MDHPGPPGPHGPGRNDSIIVGIQVLGEAARPGRGNCSRTATATGSADGWQMAGRGELGVRKSTAPYTLGLQVPSEKVGLGWVPGGSKYLLRRYLDWRCRV